MLLKHQRFRLSTRSESDVDSSVQHQSCVLYLVKTHSISINLTPAPVLVLRQPMTLTLHPSYFRILVPFPSCKFILMFVQNMMSRVQLTTDLQIKVKMYLLNAKYVDNVDIFI